MDSAIQRINESTHNLVQHYSSLVNLYVKDGTALVGRQAVKGAAAGVAGFLGWSLFVIATIVAVSPVYLSFWASFGIWALIHFIAAFGFYFSIRRALNLNPPIETRGLTVVDPTASGLSAREIDREIRLRGMVP